MAQIKSASGNVLLSVDTTSKAMRIIPYSPNISTSVSSTRSIAKATYSAFCAPFTPPATPSCMFAIFGSTTKLVKVTRMVFSSIQTSAGINRLNVFRRDTALIGGTGNSVTAVPHDSNSSAATATVYYYSANPTTQGAATSSYYIWFGRINSPAAATAAAEEDIEPTPTPNRGGGQRQQGKHLDKILVDHQGVADLRQIGWINARERPLTGDHKAHKARTAQCR
jgi:hypothetical protein